MRAVTVGFAILGMRAFKSAFGEDVAAAFAALVARASILFPAPTSFSAVMKNGIAGPNCSES
jgi:hypothetical protein